MHRHVLPALLLLLLGSSAAPAQEWATKMFPETSHNFGTVVRGSKVEFHFKFKNPYTETVHAVSVNSSCHCTEPKIGIAEAKTGETGDIVATLNTQAFSGHRAATVTVTFDKPFYAEVQLNVWADIRSDIAVEPGMVELGTVDQGQGAERRITVTRYGRSDWQITDVRSVNTNLEVEVSDPRRGGDQVVLRPDGAAEEAISRPGYIRDQLILMTNDSAAAQFPIDVEGSVNAELNVSPQVLALGTVAAGATVQKPLIINSAHKPFTVSGVHCSDDAFSFKTGSDRPAKVQIVTVTFTAPAKAGKIARKIHIDTDAGPGLTLDVLAQATVKAAPAAVAGTAAAGGSKPVSASSQPGKSEGSKNDAAKSGGDNSDSDKLDTTKTETSTPDAAPTCRMKLNTSSSGGGNSSSGNSSSGGRGSRTTARRMNLASPPRETGPRSPRTRSARSRWRRRGKGGRTCRRWSLILTRIRQFAARPFIWDCADCGSGCYNCPGHNARPPRAKTCTTKFHPPRKPASSFGERLL